MDAAIARRKLCPDHSLMRSKLNLFTFLASVAGIGFIPFMPGTFGSLAALGIYLLLPGWLFSGTGLLWYAAGLLGFSVLAALISTKAEKTLGHDAGSIVIDEVAGYLLCVIWMPHNWLVGVYAFVLFRVFDIAKPWPVKQSQSLPAGWGVVIDDLLAGVYTMILLQILLKIYPKFFGL